MSSRRARSSFVLIVIIIHVSVVKLHLICTFKILESCYNNFNLRSDSDLPRKCVLLTSMKALLK